MLGICSIIFFFLLFNTELKTKISMKRESRWQKSIYILTRRIEKLKKRDDKGVANTLNTNYPDHVNY